MTKFKVGDRISNGKTEYTVLAIQNNENGHLCYRFNNPANQNFLWVTSRADQVFKLIEESTSRDFESEWKRYIDSKGGGAVTINVKDIAHHFAEWQKQQMMKDAVELTITNTNFIPLPKLDIKAGDKVKIILVKEEQQ